MDAEPRNHCHESKNIMSRNIIASGLVPRKFFSMFI